MKIDGFQKMLTLTRKTRVKVIIFVKTRNDPRVITVILPQTVSHKPIIKIQCLTKVLIFKFPITNEFGKLKKCAYVSRTYYGILRLFYAPDLVLRLFYVPVCLRPFYVRLYVRFLSGCQAYVHSNSTRTRWAWSPETEIQEIINIYIYIYIRLLRIG